MNPEDDLKGFITDRMDRTVEVQKAKTKTSGKTTEDDKILK